MSYTLGQKMKMQILMSLVGGACIGSLLTFFTIQGADELIQPIIVATNPPKIHDKCHGDSIVDPFEEISGTIGEQVEVITNKELLEESFGVRKIDVSDSFERDACISDWYLGMQGIVMRLEIQTGHKFKPTAKVSAGPVEILEEQAAFMKDFLEETDRLYQK
jgi:hypothetical protein